MFDGKFSDHNMVFNELDIFLSLLTTVKSTSINKYIVSKMLHFRISLEQELWEDTYSSNNVDNEFNSFFIYLIACLFTILKFISQKKIRVKNVHKEWVNESVIQSSLALKEFHLKKKLRTEFRILIR